MKNYAIILGVSEYLNAHNLPACKNDADKMYKLLDATGKYEILQMDETLKKTEIIEKIDSFIDDTDLAEGIGEIFFYFSGHGDQDDTDMHYILQDTERDRINATALNNNELDNVIREKNPKLFVKVIDACESGLSYIKSFNEGNFYQKKDSVNRKSQKSFESCIFMSSSKKDESSVATRECSLFTRVFIEAVLEGSKAGTVRYSDIQNYITDEFADKRYGQTPFFSSQGDGRAIFTLVTDQIKKMQQDEFDQKLEKVETNTLQIKIDKYLKLCRSKEQVESYVDDIEKYLQSKNTIFDGFNSYYDVKIVDSGGKEFETEETILNFLYDKRKSENIYVEFETENRQKKIILVFLFWEKKRCQ